MSANSQTIAVVTGATGFVGSHVVKKLLDRGYIVRGTVRSLQAASELQQVFPKLQLYEADLSKEGAFDEVVKGAHVVFHIAAPTVGALKQTVPNAQQVLVDPAVNGTLSLLRSVDKYGKSVKKVVLTSSVITIAGFAYIPNHTIIDTEWNLGPSVDNFPYAYSKLAAEQAAWEFAKGKQFTLITIHPTAIFGPVLTSRADGFPGAVVSIFSGSWKESGVPPVTIGFVDVRDVAEAHVRAYEVPSASGRYIASLPEASTLKEFANVLVKSGKYDQYKQNFPDVTPEHADRNKYGNDRTIKELGITFTPLEKIAIDTADSLLAQGIDVTNKNHVTLLSA